jgi:hypothetical protein
MEFNGRFEVCESPHKDSCPAKTKFSEISIGFMFQRNDVAPVGIEIAQEHPA